MQKWFVQLALLLLCWLFFMSGSHPTQAHPADMYTQTYALRLAPAGVSVTYTLSPGPILAATTWHEADANRDAVVDEAEAAAWLTTVFADWESVFNGENLVWETTAVSWPTDLTVFELGDAVITAERLASFPTGTTQTEFNFNNPYAETISLNWFYVTGEEGVSFRRPLQENGRLTILLAFTPETEPLTYWDSGTPTLAASEVSSVVALGEAGDEETAVSASLSTDAPVTLTPPTDNRPYARLTQLVRQQERSPAFLITAFAIALALGAMHGLTPGHGKALVAAYLVGSRGTLKHAAALGGIVTLTHTGSVLLIGLITLVASRYFIPTDLFPILEIASGLLIIGLGLGLLRQRWRGWRGVQRKRAREEARGKLPTNSNQQSANNKKRIAIGADIRVRVFDETLSSGEAGDSGVVRWRSLAALGVSGGLVPCPDAIAILLVAVAINRVTLGISLIVSFSLGLAAILISIGIAMVQSRRFLTRFTQVERYAPAISVASAVIVLALGGWLTWQALRGTGTLTQWGAAETSVLSGTEVTVPTLPTAKIEKTISLLASSRIIFQDANEQGSYQLFTMPATGGEPVQVANAPFGIWGYAIAPDGETAVYAQIRGDRGSDLWLLDRNGRQQRLLECPENGCNNPVFAPDAGLIVYERIVIAPDAMFGTTTLWQLDLATGETDPIFQDSSLPGFSPDWSANGQWLSYITPGMPAKIQLYNLVDGRRHEFPTLTSIAVTWHPTGESLLFVDIDQTSLQAESQAFTHLLRFDTVAATLTDITGSEPVSDRGPAWSPDGTQIAFLRRAVVAGQLEQGNQIWLMDEDGSAARPLTNQPRILRQNLRWSEDGRYLLYQQYNLDTILAKSTIWLLDVTNGEIRQIADPGSRPGWLQR